MSSISGWLDRLPDWLWPEDRHRRWIHGMGLVMVGGTFLFWTVRLIVGLVTFGGNGISPVAIAGIAIIGGVVGLFTALPYAVGSMVVRYCRWPELVVGTCGAAMILDLAERIYAYGIVVEESAQNFVLTVPLMLLFSAWVLLAWGVDRTFQLVPGSPQTPPYKWGAALIVAILIGGTGFGTYRFVKDPPPEPLARVEGPEDSDLRRDVGGTLLASTNKKALLLVQVASQDTTVLIPPSDTSSVSFADGPSRENTLAYVESHMAEEFHRLKIRDVSGSRDTTLFRRSGDVLWKKAVGPPALSPRGRRVGIVRNPELDYEPGTGSYSGQGRFLGSLELWNVETKTADTLRGEVRSHSLSWLGEKRLVFAARDSGAKGTVSLPPGYKKKGLPMVSVWNVEEGSATPLLRGKRPLACAGGTSMLVQDGAEKWWQLDVSADTLSRARWPGNWKGPIGCTGEGYVVYWGLPTKGSGKAFATGEGADRVLGGDIKIAQIGTERFATIVRGVHPAGQWVRYRPGTLPEGSKKQ